MNRHIWPCGRCGLREPGKRTVRFRGKDYRLCVACVRTVKRLRGLDQIRRVKSDMSTKRFYNGAASLNLPKGQ